MALRADAGRLEEEEARVSQGQIDGGGVNAAINPSEGGDVLNAADAALSYAARGLLVFPAKEDKSPLTAHGVKDATTDAEMIGRWWRRWPDARVAIATGPESGLVVLDVDPKNGGELGGPTTPVGTTTRVRTPSGGVHLYFVHPGHKVKTVRHPHGPRPGIDVRWDGGYVLAPPSPGYEFEVEDGLAQMPPWLADGPAADSLAERLDEPKAGGRHEQLVSMGRHLRGLGRTRDEISGALYALAAQMPRPRDAEAEVESILDWVFDEIDVDEDVEHAQARTGGKFKLIDLATIEPERVNWFFEGFLPVGIPTLLAAPGGTVKGLWTVHVAAEHVPGPVLYIGSEDNLAMMVRPRVQAAGLDPSRFIPLRKELDDGTEMPLRFPRDARILEDAIVETGARLVVIDAGDEHLEEGLKSNSTEDVRRFMNPLNDVCERLRVTVLVIKHTNKVREARGSDRIGGSRTWVDANRHSLMAAVDDEDENVRHVEVAKTNISTKGTGRKYRIETRPVGVRDRDTGLMVEDDVPMLVDEGESDKSVDDLLAKNGKATEGDVDVDAEILRYLLEHDDEDEPVPSKDVDNAVSELTGRVPRTVRNRRLDLNRRGLTKAVPINDEGGRRTEWAVRITVAGEDAVDAMGAES